MNLQDCLPPELRGPATAITRITEGLSGAGVYRVESADRLFVLKLAAADHSAADWQRTLHIQRLAAQAGIAPRIVHVAEEARAVLSVLVPDRSFVAFYRDPRTHQAALSQLGCTVRRIHELPLPAEARVPEPRSFLVQLAEKVQTGFALPDFARQAIQRVLTETPPSCERALVVSHNDLNPSNLVYDGEAIRVLDWAAAGPMEPFYDLAVLAVFLRMDESTCRGLLAAYDGSPGAALPSRFTYLRRLAATLVGTMQLYLARQLKHEPATGTETLESTLPLGEFYQQLRTGALKLGTADGQWAFGLAMMKESLAL